MLGAATTVSSGEQPVLFAEFTDQSNVVGYSKAGGNKFRIFSTQKDRIRL